MNMRIGQYRWWFAPGLWMLLIGFALSAWFAWSKWHEIESEARDRFERETAVFAKRVEARFSELSTLLRATSGFFAGSSLVTPEEYTAYAREFDLPNHQPGIQGLGYAVWLPQSERDALVASMRKIGFPDFKVWPQCEGTHFSSIVSLEPQDWRNQRAVGYDMHCEQVRRTAMFEAVRSGEAVLTGGVRLVQEKGQTQPGVLLYQAIRSKQSDSLTGWVYMPIRLNDMLDTILTSMPGRENFDVRLADTTDTDAPNWVYASQGQQANAHYTHSIWLSLHNRTWQFDFAPTARFGAQTSHESALFALVSGLAISLLIAGTMEWMARSRKRAEMLAAEMTQDLREREAELNTLFQASPDATLIVDAAGRIVRHNPAAAILFGTRHDDLKGMAVESLLPDALRAGHSEKRANFMAQPQARPMGTGLNLYAQRADGSTFRIEILLAPLILRDAMHVLVVARDVSERVAQEAQRAAALAEKEILLQEVHHRVKNNLQVVHSLFELQKETVTDPAARDTLADAQSRVKAMALIHQVLYQSRDFGEVDFAGYLGLLLQDLGATLGRPGISVDTESDQVSMTLDRAIPCGLLMSEVVSNAFKHAFPDGRTGTIRLSLRQLPDSVRVEVSDDGIGLPADWQARDTLGLRLIALLAEQCGANLLISGENGTHITLNFRDSPLQPEPLHADTPITPPSREAKT